MSKNFSTFVCVFDPKTFLNPYTFDVQVTTFIIRFSFKNTRTAKKISYNNVELCTGPNDLW